MMRMIGIVFFIFFYAHLYVHFIVNPNNECSILQEITKEDITNKVYEKLPFVFDATGMKNGTCSLIEPYVRFVSEQKIYTQKKWTESRETCRTFYRVEQGCYEVSCIHPKYKDLVSHPKLLKQNTQIIRLTLHEKSILFVPNYWTVQFKAKTLGKVERITYKTPLNELSISIGKIFE
jgi:hypothetical protein